MQNLSQIKKIVSDETVRRLPVYLRQLKRFEERGIKNFSSSDLARELGINPARVRKDFSRFGAFGTPGVGYNTVQLIDTFKSILNLNKEWTVALIGVGNVGRALLAYPGFSQWGFNINYTFDKNPEKIGREIAGVKVRPVNKLTEIIRKNNIEVGIIATPAEGAQAVADSLVAGGIGGILNFAPAVLQVPDRVMVEHIDLTTELSQLIFHLN